MRSIHQEQVGFIPGIQCWFNIQKSTDVTHYINRVKEKNPTIVSMDAKKHFKNKLNELINSKLKEQKRNAVKVWWRMQTL